MFKVKIKPKSSESGAFFSLDSLSPAVADVWQILEDTLPSPSPSEQPELQHRPSLVRLQERPAGSRYLMLGSGPPSASAAETCPVPQQKPGTDLGLNPCSSETCPTLQSLAKGACGTGKGTDSKKRTI